ncbi:uncharacterized protein L969DRAFT_77352 [Mixia osmundae IAM 14324]|uniref:5-methyltetrahydropteroyltriglutamate--homocysteine S-methyltransferase n=1 Tax=Mixia osmundae (strain CBS 9802 / IAM 14324 / JCM 22182 / KY 12970) TaxID=764103 RepID=G7DX23_MIXOS|nr:uncharacterized protein L969DRAFT_77352 [Mixia osmundae IAM 14324]KEI38071.1 hypothetical protein L969DRAFT_77352 [Mixia osmundae IAM 14324]GAA95120.1 hypothetical protein E5Q_01775 [Mixia osmundae IAM 14324]
MVQSAVLGFPRIGPKREIKKAVEAYWSDKIDAAELEKTAKEIRLLNYKTISDAGVNVIPSGDFSLYDHVLDTTVMVGAVPKRYSSAGLSQLDMMFAMARGRQRDGVDLEAQEMTKWFDSNLHYIRPELSNDTQFSLTKDSKPIAFYKEAKAAGYETRPVLLGPVSYLLLGKAARDSKSYEPISALDQLVPVYEQLVKELVQEGAKEIQIDEPTLVLDSTSKLGEKFASTYEKLVKAAGDAKITVATYFERLDSNVDFAKDLPVHALHIDLDRGASQFDAVLKAVKSSKNSKLALSLGLVSGRNIWKNDFAASIKTAKTAIDALGQDRVIIATSASLVHCPVTLKNESKLTDEQRDWFSFATEKCSEVAVIAKALSDESSVKSELETNAKSIKARRDFEQNSDSAVRDRLAAVTEKDYERQSPFPKRLAAQNEVHKLPLFPTTTIGSFPQTKEIRTARSKFTKKEISSEEYDKFIAKEIEHVVRFQEKVGLDILVHGEPERNDMVQYFGERLKGFVFTENAWVQSFGSRYVRPPIVVSDISRPAPMTVQWSSYAQSLTKAPVKGMLTGPVTCLAWSYPRADVSKEVQCKQLGLALRDEVVDLEKAGIFAIQVDEPAIRELMPLRRSDWDAYLTWAVDSFRLATAGVKDSTQTHSHFCYSDFNDIFQHIQKLDADVISIEASKSDLKLLNIFETFQYQQEIGPGVFDIHSPRVPSQKEIQERIAAMLKTIEVKKLFINPDCGLKTRQWQEVEQQLANLVGAAKWAREEYGNKA